MPRIRPAENAFNTVLHSTRQPFVCRTCRIQHLRALHSSPRTLASEESKPFLQRMKDQLFGSKESKEKDVKRKEAQSKALTARAVADPTKLKVKRKKGGKYLLAPVIDPQSTYEGYTPATSWDGLERVGGTEYVRSVQDRGEVYQGFMPSKRVQLDDAQVARLLRHVVVEVLALQKAGRNVGQVCYPRDENDNWQYTTDATITLGEDGAAGLTFDPSTSEHALLKAIPKQRRKQSASETTSNTLPTLPATESGTSNEQSWMNMKIRDPAVKFAISKRLTQLTGNKPSDFLLSSATNITSLYNIFKAKETPKKLAQSAQLQAMDKTIPNVTVHAKKRTLVTKEKAVGRWKLIEEELIQRDLPVTGSRWVGAKPRIVNEWVR